MLETYLKKNYLYPYTITFYLQFLCLAGYLKRCDDTPKFNINKYTNYNIIEIQINRLNTTTQFFIAIDYSTLISEKYYHFRKRQRHLAKTFFSQPVKVTGSMSFSDMYKNLTGIGIIQAISKLTIFVNLWISKFHNSLYK